jgi:thioredoxin-related protein
MEKEEGNPMKRLLVLRPAALGCLATSFLLSVLSPGLAQEVEWRTDYAAARKEASEKNLPLIIDFSTENCFYCKRLDATTFREPAISSVMNERFIPLKIDGGRESLLAERLAIQVYPTLLFASPDGRILDRPLMGYVEPAMLLEKLQTILRLTRTREVTDKETTPEGLATSSDLVRSFSGTQTAVEANRMLGSGAATQDPRSPPRVRRAQEYLAQVKEDFRTQQYLSCLSRCEVLAMNFADLAEAGEALQLAAEIKRNPEWMRQACDTLGEQLGGMYLALAESWLRKGQPQQAAVILERVVQTFPGSRQAEIAQVRLSQITAQPARPVDFKTP